MSGKNLCAQRVDGNQRTHIRRITRARVHELVVNYAGKRAEDDDAFPVRLYVDPEDKGSRRQSPKGVGNEGRRCGLHGGTGSSGY